MESGKAILPFFLLFVCAVLVICAGCTGTAPQQAASSTLTSRSPGTCSSPELIFSDPEFAFELRRTMTLIYSGEADLGESLYTAKRITEGDFESWYREWYATAEHLKKLGDESLAQGHAVSAREAYYRAATYYRTAEFFLHKNPSDPRILTTWQKNRDTFRDAVKLDTIPVEIVRIPYGNTTLPGYFYSVDSSKKPRPLLIVQTGFDGCQEELRAYAVEGVKRGYNVLTFEGPGQGEMIRVQEIPFRADWENVVTPVIDYAVARPDVDRNHIALWGISLGGYFAPRAAAHDQRIAVLIADGGVYNPGLMFSNAFASPAGGNVTHGQFLQYVRDHPFEIDGMMRTGMQQDTQLRWLMEHGMYTFNASSPAAFILKYADLSMEGEAEKIRCPTFVGDGASDSMTGGQAQMLYDHLTCPKVYVLFTDEYEAGYHCQMGAFGLSFTKKFDWLDDRMGMVR